MTIKSITIKISNSKVGIETSEKSSNNNLYNNAIINSINGIVVKTGASDNTFHLNKIVNATEFEILNEGDPGTTTISNTFENNKLINSRVNTSVTTSTMALDENDNVDKYDGINQDDEKKE